MKNEFELWVVLDAGEIVASFTSEKLAQAFADGMTYIIGDDVVSQDIEIQKVPTPKY